ncbi:hypothetical protein [Microcoleus sp.]
MKFRAIGGDRQEQPDLVRARASYEYICQIQMHPRSPLLPQTG